MKNRRPYHNSKCSLFYEAYYAHMNSAPGIEALTYYRNVIALTAFFCNQDKTQGNTGINALYR